MLFQILFSVILLGSAYAQLESVETKEQESAVTELDTSEPTLWEMAAFAARQMSTKERRFKLATLSAAEKINSQINSLYRLKVTLQRVNVGTPIDRNDVLFCTVEMKVNEQQQREVDNFGCSLPAVVRRRRPQKKVQVSENSDIFPTNKYETAIDNSISDNKIDSEEPRKQTKRQTRPFYLQQALYQPRYQTYQYVPVYPHYPVYYQSY